MELSLLELGIYAVASFIASVLSGMAGGGGGFITTPILIFLGLSPAQAIATSKLTGVSISVASLAGLRGSFKGSRRQLVVIAAITVCMGLIGAFAITNLDNDIYQRLLGALLLLMIPVLYFTKAGKVKKLPTNRGKVVGYISLTIALGLQAIFSGGLGALVTVALVTFLGMTAIEANATKRYTGLLLNLLILPFVIWSGLLVLSVALMGICTTAAGGYLGSKAVVRRGDTFATGALMIFMLLSGVALLVS